MKAKRPTDSQKTDAASGWVDGPSSGRFGMGRFNTQQFNARPVSGMDKKPAPEAVPPMTPESLEKLVRLGNKSSLVVGGTLKGKTEVPYVPPPGGTVTVLGGGQPPPPDPSFSTMPVRVSDPLDIRQRKPVTKAPPPVTTVRGNAVSVGKRESRALDREAISRHLNPLLSALEEIEAYDPKRHHNRRPPSLWSSDPNFQKDIRALLGELKRLNDLLEAGREPSATVAEKMGRALTAGAGIVFKAACQTVGVSLGLVILASFAEILSQLGLRKELSELLSWTSKLK